MARKRNQQPNDRKLRELVVLISTLSEGDEPFGKVKLNKLLFFADFIAYRKFGKSITGHEYQKLREGPAPRHLLRVIPALAQRPRHGSDIVVRKERYFGRDLNRPFALRTPNVKYFDFAELQLITDIVKKFRGKSAREISDRSHDFIGWKLAKLGETIPYSTVLVCSREPTDVERKHGLELERLARKKLHLASNAQVPHDS